MGEERRSEGNTAAFEDEGEQLLPGLPNHIILHQVVPKLPWWAFHILSSVSRGWQQAIQSRQIYDARVCSNSTETLVVVLVSFCRQPSRLNQQIALYSMRDKCCYQLPHFPHSDRGIPLSCRCVAFDGKVYILGGEKEPHEFLGCSGAYVYDLAGQSGWVTCTNMHEPRYDFGCAVKTGKIYVFGGTHSISPVCGSEVYDPEENTWSQIEPMPFWRFGHQVATLGEELIVYRGQFYDRDYKAFEPNNDEDTFPDEHVHFASLLEVYHPVEDRWRVVQPVGKQFDEVVFPAQGKLHSLTDLGIDVYNNIENTWSHLHTNSFAALGPVDSIEVYPQGALAFNSELLLAVLWQAQGMEYSASCLLHSTGFGNNIEEIVWQKRNFSLSFGGNGASDQSPLIGLIQL